MTLDSFCTKLFVADARDLTKQWSSRCRFQTRWRTDVYVPCSHEAQQSNEGHVNSGRGGRSVPLHGMPSVANVLWRRGNHAAQFAPIGNLSLFLSLASYVPHMIRARTGYQNRTLREEVSSSKTLPRAPIFQSSSRLLSSADPVPRARHLKPPS